MNRYFLRKSIFLFLRIYYLLVGRFFLKKSEISVLMYHSIADSSWFFSVSPRAFERQMRYLKEYGNPVRLSDVADFVRGERDLPSYAVAVTFDDGYRDFYENALPILNKYHIPATLFVMAGEPDHKELGNNFPLLDWDGIRRIRAGGLIDIGSHAMTHKKLTRLVAGAAENEIRSSGVVLEEKIGAFPDFFAYPKGSSNPEVKSLVRKSGYKGAVTAEQRLVLRNGDFYAIPRIQVDRSHSFFEFKARLTRVADWYYKLWMVFN